MRMIIRIIVIRTMALSSVIVLFMMWFRYSVRLSLISIPYDLTSIIHRMYMQKLTISLPAFSNTHPSFLLLILLLPTFRSSGRSLSTLRRSHRTRIRILRHARPRRFRRCPSGGSSGTRNLPTPQILQPGHRPSQPMQPRHNPSDI